MDDHPQGPKSGGADPSKWRSMFERPQQSAAPSGPTEFEAAAMALGEPEGHEEPPELNTPDYKPWVLQRGRPAMMLHLRRRDPKSGLWLGWQLSYPHLFAVEYVGDKLLSLDFGLRQFVIEGRGLDDLARYLQQGMVLTLQEFTDKVWPGYSEPAIITAIRLAGLEPDPSA